MASRDYGYGWKRVPATPEEVREYRRQHHGFSPSVYRAVHEPCGTRIWYSGLGKGAHERHCPARRSSGQARTRRTLEVGQGVIIREPGVYYNRFGVVSRRQSADGAVEVRVYMDEGQTRIARFSRLDLRARGTR